MSKRLSAAQVADYERDGFVCPVPVLSTAEAQAARAELEAWEAARGAPIDFPEKSKSYLLFNWADQLAHHPRILDAVEDLIGPGHSGLPQHPVPERGAQCRLCALAPRQHLFLPGAAPACDRLGGLVRRVRGGWLHAGPARQPPLGQLCP